VDLTEEAVASLVDERPSQVKIGVHPRRPVQLDQGHLDLGMARHAGAALRAEHVPDMVRQTAGDGEQAVVACAPPQRHRGLKEVAGAVELVRRRQVGETSLSGPQLEPGVEVAVRILGGDDQRDSLVAERTEAVGVLVVDASPQLPAHRLQPLVDVGVNEVLAPVVADTARPGPNPEIFQCAGPFEALEAGRMVTVRFVI
jgi:hypothetical protein